MQSRSVFEDLWIALKGAPTYLLGYVVGFVVFILSDVDVTTITLAAVALGFALSSVWWGLAAFFVLYVFARTIGSLADSIVHTGNLLRSQWSRSID